MVIKRSLLRVDFHPEFQQIASVDTDTGVLRKAINASRRGGELLPCSGAAGLKVRAGMEACWHARWFKRLLNELQFELWIGDAAVACTKPVRKQKTDCQGAQLILQLMPEDRFPKIWVASGEESRSWATAVAPAPHDGRCGQANTLDRLFFLTTT